MTLLYRTASLRADVAQQLPSEHAPQPPKEKVESILNQALSIEEGYQTWNDICPSYYEFSVVPRPDHSYIPDATSHPLNAEGKPDIVHVYSDCRVCSQWNLFRASRIFLCQTIVNCCLRLKKYPTSPPNSPPGLTADLDAILHKTMHTSFDASESICASVDTLLALGTPFGPGFRNRTYQYPTDKYKGAGGALRGYSLIFPLWVALLSYEATLFSPLVAAVFGKSSGEGAGNGLPTKVMATYYARVEWIKGLLLHISQTLGIAQAGAIGRKSMQEGRQLGWRW